MSANWNIRVGTAVYCEADELGWYGVQCEGLSEDSSGLSDQLQQPFGFFSRPLDATVDADGNIDAGCQTFRASLGRTKSLSWLGHDPRYSDKCPPASKGSSAQWNARGSFALLDYATDTFTLYVVRDGGTKASTFVVGEDANGSPYTELRHQNGAYIAQTVDSSIMRHTGNAYIEVTPDAVNLNGATNCSASFSVGGAAAQSLVNATVASAALQLLATPLLAAGTAPVTSAALGGVIQSIAAILQTTAATQLIKGA